MKDDNGLISRIQLLFRPLVGYVKLLFDPVTPWRVRLLLLAGILYLLSPWDLLPDWILALGIVDDLAVVGLLGWLASRMTGQSTGVQSKKNGRL